MLKYICVIFFTVASTAQSWQQLNGPFGGQVTAIAASSTGILYAAVDDGGIYFSQNNGDSWQFLGNTQLDVYTLSVHPNGYIYSGSLIEDQGIWRSTDGGQTWQSINAGLTDPDVTDIVFDQQGHILIANSASGIFRSEDMGDSWQYLGLEFDFVRSILVTHSGTIFAGCLDGDIFRSIDNGQSWVKVRSRGFGDRYIRNMVEMQDHTIIAAAANDGMLRSTDNGNTWQSINTNITQYSIPVVAVSSTGTLVMGGYLGGVFRSENAGDLWTKLNLRSFRHVFDVAYSNGHFFLATSFGVYRSSDDGLTFPKMSTGITGTTIVATAVNPNSGLIFACEEIMGIHRSYDDGLTWEQVNEQNHGWHKAIQFYPTGEIIEGGSGLGGLRISEDNGNTWRQKLPLESFYSIAIRDDGWGFAGARGCLFSSPDFFDTVDTTVVFLRDVIDIDFDDINGVYFTTGGLSDGLFYSADNGSSWLQLPPISQGTTYGGIQSIAILDDSLIFAGTAIYPDLINGTIFASRDAGYQWELLSSYPTSAAVFDILVDDQGGLNVATANGLYRSTNRGANWEHYVSGLVIPRIRSLSMTPSGNLLAGCEASGMFMLPSSVLGTQTGSSRKPENFILSQNYPNPFNPSTTIEYELPRRAFVSIEIYNTLGQKVGSLVNDEQIAGAHSTSWLADNQSSGIYFYSLRIDTEITQSKRMLLLK